MGRSRPVAVTQSGHPTSPLAGAPHDWSAPWNVLHVPNYGASLCYGPEEGGSSDPWRRIDGVRGIVRALTCGLASSHVRESH